MSAWASLSTGIFGRSRCMTVIAAIAGGLFAPTETLMAQSQAHKGATAGGVAGAIIGGIVGHQNDEVPEGILIGGAVGALTGGLLGNVHDKEIERQRYLQQQAYYQQQQEIYRQQQAVTRSGVGTQDVVNMSRSGLSESLMISQIQARGVQRRLEVSEIIALHQQGVSDNVISAMQRAPLASELATPPPAANPATVYSQPTVIVEEPVIYSRPPVVVERVYRSHPYPHRYRPYYRKSTWLHFDL